MPAKDRKDTTEWKNKVADSKANRKHRVSQLGKLLAGMNPHLAPRNAKTQYSARDATTQKVPSTDDVIR